MIMNLKIRTLIMTILKQETEKNRAINERIGKLDDDHDRYHYDGKLL